MNLYFPRLTFHVFHDYGLLTIKDIHIFTIYSYFSLSSFSQYFSIDLVSHAQTSIVNVSHFVVIIPFKTNITFLIVLYDNGSAAFILT